MQRKISLYKINLHSNMVLLKLVIYDLQVKKNKNLHSNMVLLKYVGFEETYDFDNLFTFQYGTT